MLGLAAAVLFGPFLLITKVNKRINTKISDKAILIHKWWNIRLVKHAKSSFSYIFNNHWEEIKFALSNLLDEEGFAELLDVMKLIVATEAVRDDTDSIRKDMPPVYSYC